MSLFPTTTGGDFVPLFRLLDDYDSHRANRDLFQTPSLRGLRSITPRFDVRETENTYHLDGELPGALQKNIDIEFSDPQTLVIKGHSEREYRSPDADRESKKEDASDGHRYWVSERSTGEFQRVFTFPNRVDQDNVKASLKNGILSITVPKAAAPAAKKITIQ